MITTQEFADNLYEVLRVTNQTNLTVEEAMNFLCSEEGKLAITILIAGYLAINYGIYPKEA